MNLLNDAINDNVTELLYETLCTIQLFVEKNTQLIGELLKYDIIRILLNLINSNIITKYRVHQLCFSLLGCLLLGTQDECKFILSHNIIEESAMMLDIIKENFSKEINKIAIEISFMLSNLVFNDMESTKRVLIEDNILENILLIDVFFQNYEVYYIFKKYKKHILLLLKNSVYTLEPENFVLFIKSKGFNWLINCLNSHYLEFLYDSLKIIQQLLQYNQENPDNFFASEVENLNIETKLNELVFSNLNDKIPSLAKEIIEVYFKCEDKIAIN